MRQMGWLSPMLPAPSAQKTAPSDLFHKIPQVLSNCPKVGFTGGVGRITLAEFCLWTCWSCQFCVSYFILGT